MKYYKLVQNFHNYGYFVKDKIYPEDAETSYGFPLKRCLRDCPEDWIEVTKFKFGREYIYE